MDFVEIEQAKYDKLKLLILNNSLIEAKEYAYELLNIKNKDLMCYLFLVKIYSALNNSLKVQNILSKLEKEISYYKDKQTKYYNSQLEKCKEVVFGNTLALDENILMQLKEMLIER